jgi:hypothetical protein
MHDVISANYGKRSAYGVQGGRIPATRRNLIELSAMLDLATKKQTQYL